MGGDGGHVPQAQKHKGRSEVCHGSSCTSISRTCYSLRVSNRGYVDVIEAVG